MTTMMTKTKLSALALAAAAFTTATLLASGSASADELKALPGHVPVVTGTAPVATSPHLVHEGTIVGGTVGGNGPIVPPRQGTIFGGNGPVVPPRQGTIFGGPGPAIPPHQGTIFGPTPPSSPPPKISCGLPCTTPPDRDHDPDPDHDHDRDHDHDHGYYHDHDHDHGYDRDHGGYGWGYQPGIVVEGVPSTVAVPARVSVPATQVVEGPCNCLTKQKLSDGSVLFQDICTKESAIAAPQAIGGR
jgi:hypothetical protein